MARPRIHDDAVRQRLLEVSSEIIGQQGADAVSVRKVANSAETTTAAIYSVFGSREALIEAVVIEGFSRFAHFLKNVPHTQNPSADLLELGRAYRANALQNPHYYRAMFNDVSAAKTAEHTDETFDMLVAAVERATQVEHAEARVRAHRVWAFIHGLVSLELAGLTTTAHKPATAEDSFIAALRAGSSLIWE